MQVEGASGGGGVAASEAGAGPAAWRRIGCAVVVGHGARTPWWLWWADAAAAVAVEHQGAGAVRDDAVAAADVDGVALGLPDGGERAFAGEAVDDVSGEAGPGGEPAAVGVEVDLDAVAGSPLGAAASLVPALSMEREASRARASAQVMRGGPPPVTSRSGSSTSPSPPPVRCSRVTVACWAKSATVASNAAGVWRATTAAWSRLIRPSRSAAAVAGSSSARRAMSRIAAACPRESPTRSLSQCSGERSPAACQEASARVVHTKITGPETNSRYPAPSHGAASYRPDVTPDGSQPHAYRRFVVPGPTDGA